MLPTIKGTELPNSFLSAFSFEKVLKYYDGPRLVLQKSRAGQLYLAWWSDADDSTERWIYLPLSESRLRQILSGEMPSLEGLQQPEDGSLFVIDKDLNTDSIIRIIQTDAATLPDDALPRPGASLNIPIPKEISGLATREGAPLLDISIESAGQGRDGGFAAVSASPPADLADALQELAEVTADAEEDELEVPSDVAFDNARSLLKAMYHISPRHYAVYPTSGAYIAIDARGANNRIVVVMCGSTGEAMCYAIIDGESRRARYSTARGLPDGFIREALSDLGQEPV